MSGGQKAVLRLAWILAVSEVVKSKFLFLDETINNIDVHTIGRVAKMLKGFLAKADLKKFYVITHSPQIQQLDIWEKIVEL